MSWRRLLSAGVLLAVLAGMAGGAFELWRFGPSADSASTRVERYVRQEFDRMSGLLTAIASSVASDPSAAPALDGGPETSRTLFELLDRAAREAGSGSADLAVTIYDNTRGTARAWIGRPADVPLERIKGPAAFFVKQSTLGLRLVHLVPIVGPDQLRRGSVAVEHVLTETSTASTMTATTNFDLATPFGPASLRMSWEGAGDRDRPHAFVLRSGNGDPLVEVSVSVDTLRRARAETRRRVAALMAGILAATALLLIGPALERRASTTRSSQVLRTTVGAILLAVAGAAGIWLALFLYTGQHPDTPVRLLLGAATALAMVSLLLTPAMQLRLAMRTRRRSHSEAAGRFAGVQLAAGAIAAGTMLVFEWQLRAAVDPSTIDLRHFSLHPWTPTRLVLLAAILTTRMVNLWGAALVLTAALARWRVPPGAARPQVAALWMAPAVAIAVVAQAYHWPVSVAGLLGGSLACTVAALFVRRATAFYRHTTIAARIIALFVAFLVPSLLLYPSVNDFAEEATRQLIATKYAVEAHSYAKSLQSHTSEAQGQIDALSNLPDLVSDDAAQPCPTPDSKRAFSVWSQTVLAQARLTSAVELYNRNCLVSRFALNFPEYTTTATTPPPEQEQSSCEWDQVYGEASPFGSEERRMLHAARRICSAPTEASPAQWIGSIVVHVVLDPRRLPFITSQSPYFEVFRPDATLAPREGATGGDVDVVVYGWSLGQIYSSGGTAWPITPDLFARLYSPSREAFWTTVRHDGRRFQVYFSNDRNFIYALGYPLLTPFDHFVNIAELTTLAGTAYVLVLLLHGAFTRIARVRPRTGRALLREIRASFHRKLFLAFVAASIVPVLTLALFIRTYFANQLQEDIAAEAARTAAVAQRVIEQSSVLQRRTAEAIALSDDVMVFISQVINQDVNIFDGPQLSVTSERDLFESGLLATRTPDDVYRAIILQRLPSFVGEDRIGTFPYLIAAAPVRLGERDSVLTVPLANRQRDIERETDDLDRGVHLAALCFILLGAGIGLLMAERIADPVRRLTRATRRIAGGDFDAQIAVRSADELRRLVDAFNSMAAELKAQRAQLERTHRIEAWAEMARQVAHEIKNPLTPIQLSAEHLRRVHADRGEPLGHVLESCVDSILGQVRLLRQISAEFSSFASSPTARPAPVDVPEVVADVIEPYRTGLQGRIDIVNRVRPPLPRVFVDRTLVTRALANVVENALHAMPGGGSLTLDASEDGGMVVVGVRDTGLGMDEEALARVFEPYFSTKTTGTGLGLPIARRNIELNGGTIEVESEKGRGTLVRIALPVEGITGEGEKGRER